MTAAQAQALSAVHADTGNLPVVHEAISAAARMGLYDVTLPTVSASAVRILRGQGYRVHTTMGGWLVSWEPAH